MNIVYCFNDNYEKDDKEQIMLLTTTLVSLFENHKDLKLNIFIIYSNFNNENLIKFKKYFSHFTHEIIFIKLPNKFDKEINFMMSKSVPANKGNFIRLFIGELLPKEIEKVIYLDTDTIINKSLFDFYKNSDFEGKSMQVILDNNKLFSKEKEKILNLKKNTYFNSGILYLNLDKIRNSLLKKSLEVCKKHNNLFADQDILNIAYNNSIKIISNRYNYIVNNSFSHDVFIYHYASMGKILKIRPSLISKEYKNLFWNYFNKTIYKGYKPKIKFSNIIIFIIYKIIPKKILLFFNKSNIYKKIMYKISNHLLTFKK